jgi:hypothetical protein
MTAEPLDAEDAKLVVLARAAMARAEAGSGAAVRDVDGRTYAGTPVDLSALQLTALHRPVMTAPSVKPLRKITGNLATVSRSAAEPT